MPLFDILAGFILALSLIYSMVRGMVRELFALLAYIGGYFVAIHFYNEFSVTLSEYISNPTATAIASFVLIFMGTVFVISLIGKGMQKLVHSAPGLSGLDRLFGGAIGLVKGVIILIILMFPLRFFPDFNRDITRDSFLAPKLMEISNVLGEEVDTDKIINKIPKFDLDGVKKNLKDLKGINKLTDSFKPDNSETQIMNGKPQDEYTKEDKNKLNDILLSIDEK